MPPQVLDRSNNANYNAIDYFADTNRVRARHPYWWVPRNISTGVIAFWCFKGAASLR